MDAKVPAHATLKGISATYNQDTITRELLHGDETPHEIWAQVVVAEGEVDVKIGGAQVRVTPGNPAVIPPNTKYAVAGTGKPVRFHLNFFHEPILADGKSLASQLGRRVA